MTIEELINKVAGLSQDEKVALGRACVSRLYDGFSKLGMDDKTFAATMTGYISLFVSADKLCSAEEYQLVKSIYDVDMTYDQFYTVSNGGANPEFIAFMDTLADSLTGDMKSDICIFGLCILVSDNKLTQSEYDLFVRILK